ncbi:autotransporter assembly complex protein TamA [Photobacterium sp. R1]
MMTLFRRCLLTVAVFVVTLPVRADMGLNITGLSGSLKKNVDIYVAAIPKEDYSPSLRFRSQLETEIRTALKALGRYQPVLTYSLEENGQDSTLTVQVEPGPKTQIAVSDIRITGEAADDLDFFVLKRDSRLEKGRTLNHGKYDAFKSSLESLALRKGYFDAKLKSSRLEVAPGRNQAFIHIEFDSGRRYKFGEIDITGSQIDEHKVRSLSPFEEGDYYLVSKVGEYNQRLSTVGWFSSIFVGGDVNELGEGTVPIRVDLRPEVKNKIETGIGYSTDVGARLKFNWRKPWINSAGHSLDVRTEISKIQPKVQATYKIPLDNVLEDYYQLIGAIRYVDNHDTISTEYHFGVERHWRFDHAWNGVASVRLLYEDYRQGEFEQGTSFMVIPGLSVSRTRLRGGSWPTWGDKQLLQLEYSDPAFGSDHRLVKLRGRSAWIRSYAADHRFLARLDAGTIWSDALEDIPPSMRFFIGGDNSLRGYHYESISPHDSEGKQTGGENMLASTLEYQYRLTGNWWGALFYDYGASWIENPDWQAGAGFGIRWASPVGPIRLDFAWGLDKPDERFQLHFVLGPEL